MRGEGEPAPGTITQLFGECVQITDWQGVILRVAEQAWSDRRGAIWRVRAIFEMRITALGDGVDWSEADQAALDWAVRTFEIGALVGAGLMRTWPQQPEDLDGWFVQACSYVGLTEHAGYPLEEEALSEPT
jgi:hypothetical protein